MFLHSTGTVMPKSSYNAVAANDAFILNGIGTQTSDFFHNFGRSCGCPIPRRSLRQLRGCWVLHWPNATQSRTRFLSPILPRRSPPLWSGRWGRSSSASWALQQWAESFIRIDAVWFIRNTYKKHSLEFWKFKKRPLVCQEGLRNSGTHFV